MEGKGSVIGMGHSVTGDLQDFCLPQPPHHPESESEQWWAALKSRGAANTGQTILGGNALKRCKIDKAELPP